MALRLFNTMSSQIEDFRTLRDREVRMYACGPTVYDYGHIGNFRTFVAVDLLHRFLRQSGYSVRYVMNITDVDDKIIRNAARDGVSVQQYTAKYEKAFLEDAAMISIEQPTLVRATEHIPEMADVRRQARRERLRLPHRRRLLLFPHRQISAVRQALEKRFQRHARRRPRRRRRIRQRQRPRLRPLEGPQARRSLVGHGYRAGASRLAPRVLRHVDGGARRKLSTCTPAAKTSFSRITKTKSRNRNLSPAKQFARFWFHARFLLVEGEKMSKSLGNFFTLRDLVLKGHKPSSIRYLLASVPYRNQLNFTFDGLKQAAVSVDRLRNFRLRLSAGNFPGGSEP